MNVLARYAWVCLIGLALIGCGDSGPKSKFEETQPSVQRHEKSIGRLPGTMDSQPPETVLGVQGEKPDLEPQTK